MIGARRTRRPPLFTVRTLVILLVAVLVGLAAGWLTSVNNLHPAAAILAGGAAFGTSLVAMHQLVE